MKKYIIAFWIIWLALVFVGQFTILKSVSFPKVLTDFGLTLNLLERVSGVFIYTLLFVQIISGAYMDKLTNKLGGWIFKVHTIQGPFIYLFALIHPLLLLVFNYKIFHTLDPFYIYTQVCFLCKTNRELFYTFGRLGLWFLSIGVFVALFRNSDDWLKMNWRKLHALNYIAFFFVALHGYFIGGDFRIIPLNYLFYASLILVVSTIILKIVRKI
jgi:predicted ferric reductase